MQKKYIVRLSEEERHQLTEVIKKLQGSSQKVRRAYILLQTDANGPNWTDQLCAQAYHCRTKTVENIRQRFVEGGGLSEHWKLKSANILPLRDYWMGSRKLFVLSKSKVLGKFSLRILPLRIRP